MPTSKRQQPKRKVSDVSRTGSYPNVWWEHRLECGHVERRKRKSPAGQIACDQCGAATGIVVYDEAAAIDQYEATVAAQFASQFRLEPEAVSVSAFSDGGHLKVATVTLSLYRSFP